MFFIYNRCFLIGVFSLLGFAQSFAHQDLPPPYDSVEVLPFDRSAHFGKRQMMGLSLLLNQYNVHTVIEIGSYLGASTRFIAERLPEGGKVYAVDHWLGDVSWQNDPKYVPKLGQLYQQFLSNIIHAELTEKIVPMRMNSLTAAKLLKVKPDLIFIDGSHDYQSVYENLKAWYPHVKGHGILCGDDYGSQKSKPVKRAVNKFAKEHNLKIHLVQGWFWFYEER